MARACISIYMYGEIQMALAFKLVVVMGIVFAARFITAPNALYYS